MKRWPPADLLCTCNDPFRIHEREGRGPCLYGYGRGAHVAEQRRGGDRAAHDQAHDNELAAAEQAHGIDTAATEHAHSTRTAARQQTHHTDCWRDHHRCAMRCVEELEARVDELEGGVQEALAVLKRTAERDRRTRRRASRAL